MKKGEVNFNSILKTQQALADTWTLIQSANGISRKEINKLWRSACEVHHIRKIGLDDVMPYLIAPLAPTFDDTASLKACLLDRYSTEKKPENTEETVIQFEETDEETELMPTDLTFDGKMMSSLYIAQETGKRHGNVLRDIDTLLGQGVNHLNFEKTTYTDSQGRTYPCYNITKKGCLILITGYRPDLREKIIDRWEALETGKATPLAQMDTLDFLQLQLQAMKENRDRIQALESRLDQRDRMIEQNRKALENIPLANESAPTRTERSLVGELVSRYAIVNLGEDYEGAWDKLYREFEYRYHVDLPARAKNAGADSTVAYAEGNGYIHQLYVLASGMFGQR